MVAMQDLSTPKRARLDIKRLMEELSQAQARLSKAIGRAPSNIRVNPYDSVGPVYLSDRATVEYSTRGGTILVLLRDGMLELSAVARDMRGEFVIQRRASNVVLADIVARER
jgi:hypothetical protein